MSRYLVGFGTLALLFGCSSDPEPCEGPNGPCIEIAQGADLQTRVQTALINAKAGDVIFFEKGTYEMTGALSLDVDGVTIRGRDMDNTILSFKNQTDGAEGILVTSDNFTIEDIAVEDTAGDAIKVVGSTGVTFRRTRAEWTNGPDAKNGAYGLYPVECTNVLIEDSVARGASDAGIYVGQSMNIIVRRNLAELNVAGIEIENSFDADVYDNVATKNTGGILVFNLPGLQIKNGSRTRVFDNEVFENNTPNFAPVGNIVGKVPTGTGFASIAAHQVEVFNNSFRDNDTVNFAVISYLLTELEYTDAEYDPYSDRVYAYDNELTGGGALPGGELGFVLVQALVTVMPAPVQVPDIVFDGYMDPAKANGAVFKPEFNLCFQNNGDADFGNLDAANMHDNVTFDASPHDCAHPKLPAVSIPGVQ